MNKKIEISNANLKPNKYTYGIFCTDYSYWIDSATQVLDEPKMLSIRDCWLYEDA